MSFDALAFPLLAVRVFLTMGEAGLSTSSP
jgi:hypothetical protein